tara:strand:+ start:705 stop:1157 length:453 start_codon:yes stop_codon:yes gene_type:complete
MTLQTEAQYTMPIESHDVNFSVQIGDLIYRNCVGVGDIGSGHIQSNTHLIGTVTDVRTDVDLSGNPILTISFNYSSVIGSPTPSVAVDQLPGSGFFLGQCNRFFLSFKKNDNANVSSLAGYFASTTFVNNDNENYAELFAVSSEATFSSK